MDLLMCGWRGLRPQASPYGTFLVAVLGVKPHEYGPWVSVRVPEGVITRDEPQPVRCPDV